MRLIKEINPLEELEYLLTEALTVIDKFPVCIEVTKREMATIVNHPDAARIIPDYMTSRHDRLEHIEQKLKKLRRTQENTNGHTQDEYFDEIDRLDDQLHKAKVYIPKQFTQSGVVIKVAGIADNKV